MPNTEDYLDSLLSGIKTDTDKDNTDGLGGDIPLSKSSFLDELDSFSGGSSISSEEREFLAEFEKDLGMDDGDFDFESALDVPSKMHAPKVKNSEEDLLSQLGGILDEAGDTGDIDIEANTVSSDVDDLLDVIGTDDEIENTVSKEEEIPAEDVADETVKAQEDAEAEAADLLAGAFGLDAPEDDDEDDEDDAEEITAALSDIEEDDTPDKEDNQGESDELPQASEDTPSDEDEEGDISRQEVMDIGELLDSIDEDGNLSSKETDGTDASVIDTNPQNEEKPQEEEAPKKGLAKILAIVTGLFKFKPESEEPPEPEIVEEPEEEPVDKAEAKRLKKEAKKKEAEEKKKKKKEEKEAKAAAKQEKPKKEKKPKVKVKDTSPKIPIGIIVVFLLLSASIFVLWNILQQNISYQGTIKEATAGFDQGRYMDSYRAISAMDEAELTDEDVALLNKARLMSTLEYRWKRYRYAKNDKNEIQAIDELVKGAVYYYDHSEDATGLAISDKFDTLGKQIVDELQSVYQLSEADIKDLVSGSVRKEYTKQLYLVLERLGLWSYKN